LLLEKLDISRLAAYYTPKLEKTSKT
jgi:hypothetical protein